MKSLVEGECPYPDYPVLSISNRYSYGYTYFYLLLVRREMQIEPNQNGGSRTPDSSRFSLK